MLGSGRGAPPLSATTTLAGCYDDASSGSPARLLGLIGVAYGVYAILRGGRNQEGGGLGPIPERTIHAVAGIRMLIGGGHLPRGRGDISLPLRLNPAQVLESG